MEQQEYKYRAFISYSHRDELWARWLHRSIEAYRVPRHLVGRDTPHGPIPARLTPVFRDRDELPSATSLGAILNAALQRSQFQIVICSTASAKSHWVNEEILGFKRLGREDRIFCLLIDGEPGASFVPGLAAMECFAPALLYTMGADGQLTTTRSEPIAADARKGKDGRLDARLKIIAGMLNVGLDELKQREAQRRRQRVTLMLTASTTGMLITSGLATTAWLQSKEAQRQRVVAEEKAEEASQIADYMVRLFKVSDPNEALGNTITARDLLDKGARTIETELADQPAVQATMMDTMGTVYSSLGLFDTALPLMRQALTNRRELFGPQHEAVAQSLNSLGTALTLTADYTEAERNLSQALSIRQVVKGKESAEVAATLSSLAELKSAKGEYSAGTPLIEEALRVRRKLYGDRHPLVAESIANLGQNLGERGELKQAEAEMRRALAMQRELHPGVHTELAEAINNLAWVLMQLNSTEEAETLYVEALAMMRKLQGEKHQDVATMLNNIGYAREVRGDYAAAETAYTEALAMNRETRGERHPETILNTANLAFVKYAKGQRTEAIRLLRTALELRRQVQGARHPDVAGDAASLAYWLIDQQQYGEATQLIEESLAIRREKLGEKHPAVATALAVKSSLLLAQRRYREAAAQAEEAQKILTPEFDAANWQMAMAMNAHGAALAGLGQFAQGERLLKDSLAGLKDAPLSGLYEVGQRRLAELYAAWGKPEQTGERVQP
ncbi:MAG TPA: toll/interleukin-1 receptor domain-containing protein [Steroidobacteraceae bacterium]|nr:toll/interleukin-1 receptor domain-containing protein [Steroidobacteraceae bacterium]